MPYKFFEIEKREKAAVIWLNRPRKRNFMNEDFWFELPEVVEKLENDDSVAVLVFAAKGSSFSMGLDITSFLDEQPALVDDSSAEKRHRLYKLILKMQKGMNAIEACSKPSIVVIHRHCIGAGLDLASACDIRIGAADALVSLREAKVAIVADMGSLQRLPAIIGEGKTRELAFTAKDIDADEALRIGLFNHVYDNKEAALEEALKMASEIAANPLFVVAGAKHILNKGIDMPRETALEYVAQYNAAFLHSTEFRQLVEKMQSRRK